jgi:hypothetical protein
MKTLILFVVLVLSIRALAIESQDDPRTKECVAVANAIEDKGTHKYNGILYKNDFVVCGKVQGQNIMVREIVVMVKNSKDADMDALKALRAQYKTQLIKDFCPGVSAHSWKVVDEVNFIITDLDNKSIGSVNITPKDCKI